MKLSTTREYVEWLFQDNGVVELRHQDDERWVTGWFDNSEKLLPEARKRGKSGNLYTSLNAPKPRPVTNSMSGLPLRDDDVGWITRIPFDFDPTRPTGVCSTDDELFLAYEQRDRLVAALHGIGWPVPLIAKSGNGYHAQYRTRLPNNSETKDMLRVIYSGLHAEFNTPEVGFDRTVRNPGRIFRLYGTINCKGQNLPERPWRQSTVWIPDNWRQATAKQIESLANGYARRMQTTQSGAKAENRVRPIGSGDYRTLDIVAWFTAHGLYKRHLESTTHAVECPWSNEHSTPGRPNGSDTVIFEGNGDAWPGFFCHHAHCDGRRIGDVMALWGDADQFCSDQWVKGVNK